MMGVLLLSTFSYHIPSARCSGFNPLTALTWGYRFYPDTPYIYMYPYGYDNGTVLLGDKYVGVAGIRFNTADSIDIGILIADSLGNAHYRIIGRTTHRETGTKLTSLNGSSSLVILGEASEAGGGGGSRGLLIVKVDTSGTVFWAKKSSSVEFEGGVVHPGNSPYVFVLTWSRLYKVDTVDGNARWGKYYRPTWSPSILQMRDIVSTNDGGAVITGTIYNPTSDYDPFIMRVDSGGNVLWAKRYVVSDSSDEARVLKRTPDGFLIVGNTEKWLRTSTNDNRSLLIINTDTIGNLRWAKVVDVDTFDLYPSSSVVFPDGYRVVGYARLGYLTGFLLDIAPDGTIRSLQKGGGYSLMWSSALRDGSSLVISSIMEMWKIAGGTYSPCFSAVVFDSLDITSYLSVSDITDSITTTLSYPSFSDLTFHSYPLNARRSALCTPTGDSSALSVDETSAESRYGEVYDASGRLVFHGEIGKFKGKRGVFFIRERGGRVRKVVIR